MPVTVPALSMDTFSDDWPFALDESFFGWAPSAFPPPSSSMSTNGTLMKDTYLKADTSNHFVAEILALDSSFFEDVPAFNPHRPTYTNFDVLMRLVHECGWPKTGVTRTELKRMLRACVACHRYMFAERRARHRCDGTAPDVRAVDFDFVQTMLSFDGNSGFSVGDLIYLLFRCAKCLRIFYVNTVDSAPGVSVDERIGHRCGLGAATSSYAY